MSDYEINQIIQELISGKPLSSVDKKIQPKLLMPLSLYKNEYEVSGDASKVRRISRIIEALQVLPKSSAIPPLIRSARRSSSADKTSVVDELMTGRTIDSIPSYQIDDVLSQLKNRKQSAVLQGKYRLSQQIEDLGQQTYTRKLEITYLQDRDSKRAVCEQQLEAAVAEQEESVEFWKKIQTNEIKKYEDEKLRLETELDQELAKFDASYPQLLPPKYRKNSTHTLQLREQEKHLISTRRYNDAIPIRREIRELERMDIENMQLQFLRNFEKNRSYLVAKQENQMECFENNWKRKFQKVEALKNHELNQVDQLIHNFRRKIETIEEDKESVIESALTSERSVPARSHPRARSIAAQRLTGAKIKKRKF